MIVSQFNTSLTGGAGAAARRLHEELVARGVDSRFYYSAEFTYPAKPSYIPYAPPATPRNLLVAAMRKAACFQYRKRVRRYTQHQPANSGLFSDTRLHYPTPRPQQDPSEDVIHLHWIADFLDYRSFFKSIPDDLPIVWTLHDMNPFTGGCHYSMQCTKFESECKRCPQLPAPSDKDMSWENFAIKRHAFHGKNLHIVTPSRWLADLAQHSTLLSPFSVTTIPNSLNTDIFMPADKAKARAAFQLPTNAKILLFVADDIANHRKGVGLLVEAVAHLKNIPNLLVVTVGSGEPPHLGAVSHRHVDSVSDETKLASLYGAADVYAIPSLQDNLPNTILESMACGTPVVGFAVGGIPEAVRPGETGVLAPPGDVEALAQAISEFLANPVLQTSIGENSRKVAVREYAQPVQAGRYLSLYESLIERRPVA